MAGCYDPVMTNNAAKDDVSFKIGKAIRASRIACRWTQRELADRLDTTQSEISRLETGARGHLDVRLVSEAFTVLGIRMTLDGATIGVAGRHEQRDLVHARCSAFGAGRLTTDRWDVRHEVEVGSGRYRGWIDLLAYRAADRAMLSAEFKTELDDLGRIQRTMGWYEREAWTAARTLGWHPQTARSALLVLCSADNDARIQANRSMLLRSFPGRAADMEAWLADSAAPSGAWPGIAMIDPRSRRSAWLRPSMSDGRRSAAPYANYRAAAEAFRRN